MRHRLEGMMGNKNHEVVTTWRYVCRVHNTRIPFNFNRFH